MSVGTSIDWGDTKLFAGPLGVCKLGWTGWDLGETSADTEMSYDEDIKDIIAQQRGTKAYDKYRTGELLVVKTTLKDISTGLLARLLPGKVDGAYGADDNGVFKNTVFLSMRDNEAGPLRIEPVIGGICTGSTADKDQMNFYEALPIIDGTLINWGVDTQRALPIQFIIFPHDVSTDSTTYCTVFGYWGDPDDNDLPSTDWVAGSPMEVDSIHITSATECEINFTNEIDAAGLGDVTKFMILNLDDTWLVATSVSINGVDAKKADFVYPAVTFASGLYGHTGFVAEAMGEDADGNTNNKVTNVTIFNDIP